MSVSSGQRPIIACFLWHEQVCQILTAARSHGLYGFDGYKTQFEAAFSKEMNDQRKACLSLRPLLHKWDIKFGLFELLHTWITRDSKSKSFFDPGELQAFLDRLGEGDMVTFQCPLDLSAVEMDPLAPTSPETHTCGPKHKDKNQGMQCDKEKILIGVGDTYRTGVATNPTYHLNRACLQFDN
ncbi:hypothetical protein NDU88_004490 [Pleurodeles waltl]|uniref:Uncharacterized protein n=1 Tax=Pleurodeles waltl TaxID=8319 RepID=A0AAV7LR47_PLEWA|nr:hypothetical protein NDU88_004490 [Pleurodeles waltl]